MIYIYIYIFVNSVNLVKVFSIAYIDLHKQLMLHLLPHGVTLFDDECRHLSKNLNITIIFHTLNIMLYS